MTAPVSGQSNSLWLSFYQDSRSLVGLHASTLDGHEWLEFMKQRSPTLTDFIDRNCYRKGLYVKISMFSMPELGNQGESGSRYGSRFTNLDLLHALSSSSRDVFNIPRATGAFLETISSRDL